MQLRSANPSVRSVIKADRGVDYGPIEDVMTALKEARITRFSLITDLEGDDSPA
jgi:biopolymer transport protein ExbD